MNEIGNAVCAVVRRAMFGADPGGTSALPDAGSELWESIFDEMTAHGIYGLADKVLDAHPLSDAELLKNWKKLDGELTMKNLRILAVQQRIVRLFSEADLRFAIIKGSAAAYLYPQPFLRAMGDIDILVKRVDFERACGLLVSAGCTGSSESADGFHHAAFKKDGVEIELHRRLGSVPEDNVSLIEFFEAGVDECVQGSIGRFGFPMLPNMINGLVLLLHINQHLRVGIGLRQIIDWMMFVNAELDGRSYEQSFRPMIAGLGLERFAVTVTALCKRYLGLENGFDTSEADDETVAELMDYIMNKGNFGRKSGSKGHVSSVALRANTPLQLLKMLQKSGRAHWKAAERHPILRPFAWAYQLRTSMKELKKRDISSKEMRKLYSEGIDQRGLIAKLGLDVDNKLHSGVDASDPD